MPFRTLKQRFEPYWDIILFVIALLAADAIWKLCVSGDEHGAGDVTVLGMTANTFFDAIAGNVANAVYTMVSWVRDTVHLKGDYLFFDTGSGTHIVWSCTPVKQSWIWLCIILAARGKLLHKLWFVPAGWVLIYGINIVRIAAIALIIENHPDLFNLMHGYIFKYAFYGCMFLMWLIWTKWFGSHPSRHSAP